MNRDDFTFLTAVAIQLLSRWLAPGQPLKHGCDPDGDFFQPLPEHTEAGYWHELLCDTKAQSGEIFLKLFPWWENAYRTKGQTQLVKERLSFEKWADEAALHLRFVRQHGAAVVMPHHLWYPPLLQTIPCPPRALTIWGEGTLLRRAMVSVVGSRAASPYALRSSFIAGRKLAAAGIAVVSGGAFGCDLASHEGVLDLGGVPSPAVSVFANGLGELYPRSNLGVFRSILSQGGLLVSERLWATKPFPSDFATRNRIIAGMSGLLLLMQAGLKSGAMITARLALEHGSDLAVLAHDPTDVRAEGSQRLIDEGAFAFKTIDEVLQMLSCSTSPNLGPC